MAKYRADRRKARELKRLAARKAAKEWNRSFGGTSPSKDSDSSPRMTIPWLQIAGELALLGVVAYVLHLILK